MAIDAPKLTLEQIHFLVPREKRDSFYLCPKCHKWHFGITADVPPKFSCKTDECQGEAGHHAIVKILWAEVHRREDKPKQSDGPPSGKLTLIEYSMAKYLNAERLKTEFGAFEGKHPYYDLQSAVCFPDFDENGKEVQQQWRWGMGQKDRRNLTIQYCQQHGMAGKKYLYSGRFLQRLEQDADGPTAIIICEGQSNTQTLWMNGRAALGLPGVGNWQDEWKNLKCLQQAQALYFLLDMKDDHTPEPAAIAGALKVAKSFPPGKVRSVQLQTKDVSELWIFHMTSEFGGKERGFHEELNRALLDAKAVIPETVEITVELPPVEPFQYEYLPLCLRPLVQDVSERMSCPPDFPAIVGLVTLAGAINRRAHVYPKRQDKTWHPALNLWGAVVADPAKMKTPVMRAIAQPLEEITREWMGEHRIKLEDWERRKAEAKRAKEEFEEEPPRARRLLTSDTTIEALQDILANNPAGMLYLRDEMAGWLADIEKKGHESDRTFYLATWSESYYVLDRIGRGNVSAMICLSMYGNFQPGPLAQFLRHGTNDGLFQREQLIVWPDYQPFKNVDRPPNQAALDSFAKIVRALAVLPENSIRLSFDPDSQDLFNDWFDLLHTKVEIETNRAKAQHMSKYRSLVPQLAGLFQLTDCALELPTGDPIIELNIDVDHLQWAINFCGYLESHLNRIYSVAPSEEQGRPGMKPVKTEAAMNWLLSALADGERESKEDLFIAGEAKEFSEATLYEAKKRLGNQVRMRKGPGGKFYWSLTTDEEI